MARKREPVWSRSACFLIPSAAGCLTRLTDHRDRRQGGGAGGAAMPPQVGAPAAARASECAQAGERRQRSDLRPVRDHGGIPCCACYGPTSTLPIPRWPPRSNAPSFPGSGRPNGWRSGSAGCSPARLGLLVPCSGTTTGPAAFAASWPLSGSRHGRGRAQQHRPIGRPAEPAAAQGAAQRSRLKGTTAGHRGNRVSSASGPDSL